VLAIVIFKPITIISL